MRVLLFSYYFPPDTAVGALRPANLVRALLRAGHEVVVVAGETNKPELSEFAGRAGLRIVRVKPWRNPREWISALRARLSKRRTATTQSPPVSAPVSWDTPIRTGRLRRWLFSLLWLPDDRQGFIVPAVRAARREGRYDIVYSTGPVWSTHLAGFLARRLGRNWVMEFRDPWTRHNPKPPHVDSRLARAIERRLERRCLRRAARVVCASEGIRNVYNSPVDPVRLIVARNGIEWLAPASAPARVGPRRIVHAGTFYLHRDPRPFLRAVGELNRRGELPSDGVLVDLVGDCRMIGDISVESFAKDCGISHLVNFHDWMPHAAAQELVRSADVLLLLAQRQPLQVPNKLYEYLGTRRPILAFADSDGETARLLRSVGGHAVVSDDDPEAAVAGLRAALSSSPPTGDNRVLEELLTERQMAMLVKHLEGL